MRLSTLTGIATFVLSLFFSLQLYAQEESTSKSKPTEGAVRIQETEVTAERQDDYRVQEATTATKTDTPLRNIPQSIQIIDRQVIEDRQVFRLSEIAENVSGVQHAEGYGGLSSADYYIRGFSTSGILRNGFRDFSRNRSVSQSHHHDEDRAPPAQTSERTKNNPERIGRISLFFSGFCILLFLGYILYMQSHFEWKENTMHNTRYWETADETATISLCPEGCVHLRVGRAIIKMTREEFLSLIRLTDIAAREMQLPDSMLAHQTGLGH